MACLTGNPGDSAHVPAPRPGSVARFRALAGATCGFPPDAPPAIPVSTPLDDRRSSTWRALQLLSGSVVGTPPLVNLSSASASPPTSTAPPAAALVQDLVTGRNGSFPQNFVEANGTLFFLAFDQNNFFDTLWASDGTGPGTHEVAANLEANAPAALGASGSVAFTAFDLNSSSFGIWVE